MSDYFTDVPDDNVHVDSIDWLFEKDITKGTAPGIYSPDQAVSRDQMASFLRRTVRLIDPALAERDPVEPPVEPPTDMFIPKLQGPILSHDGNPTVMGSIYHKDGGVFNYNNVLIRGTVRAGGGAIINITDSELDGQQGAQCAAGWGGVVNLARCEVHNAEDGMKDNVNTVQVTVHNLYHRPGAHGDAVQLQSGGAEAVHKWSYFDGYFSDGELANAAFMVSHALGDGTRQTITVEDSYINGGNYTVFLKKGALSDVAAESYFRRVLFGGQARFGTRLDDGGAWDYRRNMDENGIVDYSNLAYSLSADAPAPTEWDVQEV